MSRECRRQSPARRWIRRRHRRPRRRRWSPAWRRRGTSPSRRRTWISSPPAWWARAVPTAVASRCLHRIASAAGAAAAVPSPSPPAWCPWRSGPTPPGRAGYRRRSTGWSVQAHPWAAAVRGVFPACRSLDCVTTFTHTVAEARSAIAVMAGFDPLDPWSRPAPAASPPALPPASGPSRSRTGRSTSTPPTTAAFASSVQRATQPGPAGRPRRRLARSLPRRSCCTRAVGGRAIPCVRTSARARRALSRPRRASCRVAWTRHDGRRRVRGV